METRTGLGFDAHRFAEGRRMVLGGVEIAHPRGLLGHSDADVLCHAVMDALLGAVGDGDIGMHFPDTDVRWKGACSLDLLKAVGAKLAARGARIVHIDCTVLAEKPKIAPHREAMRAAMGGVLGLEPDRVSIKATTMERMGTIGREEGIVAMAVATVEVPAGKARPHVV
jgi:2-C-methyl-D-erythritol 4-phosphate cytidylyltransferase/2-C-methyl-D-erythritol 2,4-cyclodiphosphate synthase